MHLLPGVRRGDAECLPQLRRRAGPPAAAGIVTSLIIARPQADEAASFYHGYIDKVRGENLTEQLGDQLQEVERLFGGITDAAALARYAEGKWSVKEVLGHLSDTERIFREHRGHDRGTATQVVDPSWSGKRPAGQRSSIGIYHRGPCDSPPGDAARPLWALSSTLDSSLIQMV